jgi:hypothetical protein
MKNIISFIFLICSVAVIIVSCAKKEESTTTPAAAVVPAGGSGTTAGGTITGNADFTGTFHLWRSGNGEPSGGCIDNETVFSNFGLHTSVKGWKRDLIVTTSTSFTIAETFYSDTTCGTVIGYNHKLYKGATIGAAVTSMTAGTDPTRPTSSKKIVYVNYAEAAKANTAAMVEKIDSNLTLGTELLEVGDDGSTKYNLIATGTQSGSSSKFLFMTEPSESDYPTDWNVNSTHTYWQ